MSVDQEMKQVFISYSSKNSELAEEICHYLEKKDINCWIAPRDIPPGENYTTAIPEAIESCNHLLLVLTPSAQNSPWVEKEVLSAVSAEKTVIPFLVEKLEIAKNFGFILQNAQWEDGSEDWISALDRIAFSINAANAKNTARTKPKKQRMGNQSKKSSLPHIKKTECPKCNSTKLHINDNLAFFSSMQNGFMLLAEHTLVAGGMGIILPILIFILYKYPLTSDYVLKALPFIPFLGNFIISSDSVGGRLFLIGVIVLVLTYAVDVVAFLLNSITTSKYSEIVEAQRYDVRCTCAKCGHEFTKSYTPDEARLRSEQSKNNEFDLAIAAGLYLGFIGILAILYAARKVLLKILLIIIAVVVVIALIAGVYMSRKEILGHIRRKKEIDRIKSDLNDLDAFIESIEKITGKHK